MGAIPALGRGRGAEAPLAADDPMIDFADSLAMRRDPRMQRCRGLVAPSFSHLDCNAANFLIRPREFVRLPVVRELESVLHLAQVAVGVE